MIHAADEVRGDLTLLRPIRPSFFPDSTAPPLRSSLHVQRGTTSGHPKWKIHEKHSLIQVFNFEATLQKDRHWSHRVYTRAWLGKPTTNEKWKMFFLLSRETKRVVNKSCFCQQAFIPSPCVVASRLERKSFLSRGHTAWGRHGIGAYRLDIDFYKTDSNTFSRKMVAEKMIGDTTVTTAGKHYGHIYRRATSRQKPNIACPFRRL